MVSDNAVLNDDCKKALAEAMLKNALRDFELRNQGSAIPGISRKVETEFDYPESAEYQRRRKVKSTKNLDLFAEVTG